MLSLPDLKEKQVLFIKSDKNIDNKLKLHNENIVLLKDGKISNRVSCHKVLAVFIVGDLSLTSVLIRNLKEYGISLFLMKNNFNVYAEINSAAEGNYELRMKQYNFKNDFELSKNIVKNKIHNQLSLLKETQKLKAADYKMRRDELFGKIEKAANRQELLGIEGSFAKDFFVLYFEKIHWYKRMPRTKTDVYNLLLDMGYTFLFNYMDAMLRLFGFDTYKGFYHQLFFQRKSLACDVVEPFRCLIDKELYKMINLKQINQKDFTFKNGHYNLQYDKSSKYAKIFLEAIMKRKEDIYKYTKDLYACVLHEKKYPYFKLK